MINKMKSIQLKTKLLLSVAIILIIASFSSIALTSSNSGNVVKTETITLNSIVCDNCVDRLNKVIGSVDGVSDVNISLTEKQAIVTFDDSKTSLEKIENAITSAGYNANDKLADKDAYDKLPACCQGQGKSDCKGMDNMNMNDSKEHSGCKDKNINMNDSKDHSCSDKGKCTGKEHKNQ